jgi:hypothetical protein
MSQGWPQTQQFQPQQQQSQFYNNQFNKPFNYSNNNNNNNNSQQQQQQQQQQNRWNSPNLNGFNQSYNQWNAPTGWSTSTNDSLLNASSFLQDD